MLLRLPPRTYILQVRQQLVLPNIDLNAFKQHDFAESNIELSCAAESPTRSEPQQRHAFEPEEHLRRQLQRFVMVHVLKRQVQFGHLRQNSRYSSEETNCYSDAHVTPL